MVPEVQPPTTGCRGTDNRAGWHRLTTLEVALTSAASTETCCTKDSDGVVANSGSEEGIGLLVAFVEEVAQRQSLACADNMQANF